MKKLFLTLTALIIVLITDAQSLSLSGSSVPIGAEHASTATFTISSDTYWGIYNVPDWISLDTIWGNGNHTIIVTANENPFTIQRQAEITVYCLDAHWQYYKDVSLSILQKPAQKGIAKNQITVGADNGSSASVSLTSNSYWEVVNKPSWLSVNNSWGTSNATITATVKKNPLTIQRRGTFQIRRLGSNNEYIYGTVSILQDASTKGISTDNITFENTQSTSSEVMLYVSDAWTMSSVAGWITPSLTSHSGNAFVSFSVSKNPKIYYRVDTLKITTKSGTVYEIEIVQKPAEAYFSITPFAFSFKDSIPEIAVSVSSNTNWGIIDFPEWISSENIFGFGDKTFTLTATDYVDLRLDTLTAYWFNEYEVYRQKPVLAGQGLPLGISTNSAGRVSVYPTIADRFISIDKPDNITITQICIVALSGKAMECYSSGTATIAIDDFPAGRYVAVIQTNQGVFSPKFIKE